jgi:16S rRNA G966 N2-methylase RsmD
MEVSKRLREITKDEALQSFKDLEELDCKDIGAHSRIGLACLDYFFLHHRIKAKTKRHISFFNSLEDKKLLKYINSKVEQIKHVDKGDLTRDELLRQRYSVFQLYYGTINQFRPTEARRVYCTLKPRLGVLDFSAGWGGRCLGAMAYGVPYIGIDANKNMKKSYEDMIKLVEPKKDVNMIFQPSETVDFSKFKYDLVFTSPPYFTLEEYEKMPDYGSREGFLERFFRPVVLNAWKYLAPSGHMALNMPKEMYDSVKSILPSVWKRMRLPIANRHPTNAVEGRSLGEKDSKARSEIIYIWKKSVRGTRKAKK